MLRLLVFLNYARAIVLAVAEAQADFPQVPQIAGESKERHRHDKSWIGMV